MMKKLFTLAVILLTAVAASAQDSVLLRPTTHVFTLQAGWGRVRDTYLTPLRYDGTSLGIRYERSRQLRHLLLSNEQHAALDFMSGDDKGDHSTTWAGRLHYDYTMYWGIRRTGRRPQAGDWHFRAGVWAGMDAGFDYNLKLVNANNPVSVRLCQNIGVAAQTVFYYGTRRRHNARIELQAPLLGWALMPEYGASYYETFYLRHGGDYMNFTSLHNQQDLDVRLTTDLQFTKYPIRLGMAWHIETMKIHDITQRYSSLQFVVGIVFSTLPFTRRQASAEYGIDNYQMAY